MTDTPEEFTPHQLDSDFDWELEEYGPSAEVDREMYRETSYEVALHFVELYAVARQRAVEHGFRRFSEQAEPDSPERALLELKDLLREYLAQLEPQDIDDSLKTASDLSLGYDFLYQSSVGSTMELSEYSSLNETSFVSDVVAHLNSKGVQTRGTIETLSDLKDLLWQPSFYENLPGEFQRNDGYHRLFREATFVICDPYADKIKQLIER